MIYEIKRNMKTQMFDIFRYGKLVKSFDVSCEREAYQWIGNNWNS